MNNIKIKNIVTIRYLIISIILLLNITNVNALDIVNYCDTLGTAGETYVMTANITTTKTPCIRIIATNVILDCNNYSIILNNTIDSKSINSDFSTTILKNCNINLTTQNDNKLYDKKALFDIIAQIVTEPKTAGEDLVVKISLINFGSSKTVDANLTYIIINSSGKIMKQYDKIISVTTQTEFLDHINTIGMPNGKYNLKIELTYIGQKDPANTEKIFYINTTKKLFEDINFKTHIIASIILLLLIGLYFKNKAIKLKVIKE